MVLNNFKAFNEEQIGLLEQEINGLNPEHKEDKELLLV